MISLLGILLDFNSSHLRGAADAPDAIRLALQSGAMNWTAESGLDLSELIQDVGNVDCSLEATAFETIEARVNEILAKSDKVISLGGDHSISFPIIKAYAKRYPELTILHFDAHPDLYHELDANPYSHASPFARIMEARLVKRLIQIGVRTVTPHQQEQIDRFGVEVVEMKDWTKESVTQCNISGDVYISFDLDALDPACAPGVSHHEPGGLFTRDVLSIIQNLEARIVGADIVEYNPKQDINKMTAFVAAKLLKEIAAKMCVVNRTIL